MKCPYCSSKNMAIIAPSNSKNTHALVEINASKDPTEIERAMPVNLYGCMDCQAVIMRSETLEVKS